MCIDCGCMLKIVLLIRFVVKKFGDHWAKLPCKQTFWHVCFCCVLCPAPLSYWKISAFSYNFVFKISGTKGFSFFSRSGLPLWVYVWYEQRNYSKDCFGPVGLV